jgi:lipoprotein-anchoring transpeptidase ErfK/SrfK
MKYQKSSQFKGNWIFLVLLVLSILLGNFTVSSRVVLAQRIAAPIAQKIIALKDSQQRWIEVDLSTQRLTAWKGDQAIQSMIVSTGKAETPTIPGIFVIQSKRSLDRMRGADYDVPNVPYTMYYHRGYAIHGAYWHNRFGTPVSHGCINLPVEQAEWLFNWTSVKTPVIIHR